MQISDIDLDKVITLAEEADVARKAYNATEKQLVEARDELLKSERAVEEVKTNQTYGNRHIPSGLAPAGYDITNSKPIKPVDFAKQLPAAENRVELAKSVIAKLQEKLNLRGEINIETHHIVRRVKSALVAENINLAILEKY